MAEGKEKEEMNMNKQQNLTLQEIIEEQSRTITKLCEAIDPTHSHGPETDKICAYAILCREFTERSVILKRLEALESLAKLEGYDGPAPGQSITEYTEALRHFKA